MTAGRLADGRLVVALAALLAIGIGYLSALSPLLALGFAGVLALTYLVLAHAELMLLTLVAVLPWDNALPYPTETVSAVKIFGVLLVLAYLIRALTGRAPVRFSPILGAVIALLLLVGTSLLLSSEPVDGLTKTLRFALFGAFLFLALQLAEDRRSLLRIFRTITLSATVAAVWALVDYVGADSGLLGGRFGDPNDFAYVLVAILPLVVFLFSHERGRRWLWGSAAAVLILALLATFSRGALVGVAALLLWALAAGHIPRIRILAGAVVVASVALIALTLASPVVEPRLDSKSEVAQKSVASREAFWLAALYMAADNPLTGVGPGRFGAEGTSGYIRDNPQPLDDPVTHNTYLQILAENGIPALCVFLGVLGGSWVLLLRSRRQLASSGDREGAEIAVALQGSLIASAAAGMFVSAEVLFPFWLVAALAATLALQTSAEPEREQSAMPIGAGAPRPLPSTVA